MHGGDGWLHQGERQRLVQIQTHRQRLARINAESVGIPAAHPVAQQDLFRQPGADISLPRQPSGGKSQGLDSDHNPQPGNGCRKLCSGRYQGNHRRRPGVKQGIGR